MPTVFALIIAAIALVVAVIANLYIVREERSGWPYSRGRDTRRIRIANRVLVISVAVVVVAVAMIVARL